LLDSIPFDAPFQQSKKPSVLAEYVIAALKDIYDGRDVSQSFPLAMKHLTNHTGRVLEATRLIPAGYVTSYGAIAKTVGGGPRAVGNVMAKNPFPPIVPCHRVVRSDLALGGYGGGLNVKRRFLIREKRGYTSEREVNVSGKKLRLYPVEFVLRGVNVNSP
jgi:methylated-DNA-[protein]-cysteine S-methyltransferase